MRGILKVVAGYCLDCFVFFIEPVNHLGISDNDAAGVEVIVKRLALAQELRREQETQLVCLVPSVLLELLGILYIEASAVAYRDGALNDHRCIGVRLEYQVNDIFDVVCVKEILLRVVIGGRRNDNEFRIAVCACAVQCGGEVKFLLCEIFLYIIVLYRGLPAVYHLHLFGDDIHCRYLVVLCQQCGNTKAYIACSCYCYLHVCRSFFVSVAMWNSHIFAN